GPGVFRQGHGGPDRPDPQGRDPQRRNGGVPAHWRRGWAIRLYRCLRASDGELNMLRSQDRILTTHTGSLPRPPALTSLYVGRSRGETIDAAELDRVGKAAVHEVVAKQIAAGIDVPNNGEQQREAFFLYVRHRMSGFGGGWTRRVFADA